MLLLAEPVPSSNGHDVGSLSGAMIGGIVFAAGEMKIPPSLLPSFVQLFAVGSVVLLLVVCYLYDWSCCKRCWAFLQSAI